MTVIEDIANCNHNAILLIDFEAYSMSSLTIKNIPEDLYQELKTAAKQHHRSINSEVIVCLKKTLMSKRISPEERLTSIRVQRSQIRSDVISPEEINLVINEGRT